MRNTAVMLAVLALGGASLEAQQAPEIHRIRPQVLLPGGRVVVDGVRLTTDTVPAVTVDGVPIELRAVSATRLEGRLPVQGFRCRAITPVLVAVLGSNGADWQEHPLESATALRLGPGESQRLSGAASHCVRLAASGRYLVPVVNAYAHPDSLLAGTMRAAPGERAGIVPPPQDTAAVPAPPPPAPAAHRAALQHAMQLQQNQEVVQARLGTPGAGPNGQRLPGNPNPARRGVRPGDVLPLRYAEECTNYEQINARAVYVSPKVVILEDVSVPNPGGVNAELNAMGVEYDGVIEPMLRRYFGNPAAFDQYLDQDGRVMVVFTHRISDYGVVRSCDFFNQASDPASNQGEVMYVQAPTPADTVWKWARRQRGTIAHEGAHMAAYAARFLSHRANPDHDMVEDSWLMEALAMQAEEIFARTFSRVQWKGNATFAHAVHCDFHLDEYPDDPDCRPWPLSMRHHVEMIWDFYFSPETSSPLRDQDDIGEDLEPEFCQLDNPFRSASRPFTRDVSFYGSGWLLLRWAADHYARDEAAFFGALSQEPCHAGTRNLVERTGRSFEELVVDWLVAVALDDRPGFTPRDRLYTIPSWNMHDVLTTLNENAFPLRITGVSPRAYEEVFAVRGASARYFEVEVPGGESRVIEVSAQPGDRARGSLHVPIVRTQ